ncbi:MAG: ketosteroid isomerase [Parvibaculum sp.]|jgi:hypothetical protein|nr:ketosteroid isomerase [Parvibaculum sp.]
MSFAATALKRAFARRLPFVLLLAGAIAPVQAGTAMNTAEAEARNHLIVREAFDGWAEGSASVFDLLAPDIRWTIHGSGPVAGTYTGIEEFMERAAHPLVSRLATPLKPDLHHIWASGDHVIIRFDASAITNAGAPYNNRFVWIFRMEAGAVAEAEAFLDLAAYRQVIENNEPRAE